ncbi:TIGR04282 family arsenosugar biosynthesis glycosyltransferase [Actinoplanes sp. RD1]|uniref:TIGR04282 family arsenosugar biosynthesis glycosyltransferase n=1 Tax=Actinoplanes sp. RD1 TaxID=3064538 RepID=UPI0027409BC1|nr:TIGR04282 family arsenosugar biosynthesis glycosyltransferase [Actinoplanes sp. RD1]
MTPQVLVLAKTPVPGRVKTRLCPPYTPEQAAAIAAAALADTVDAVGTGILVIEGDHPAPRGWTRTVQRGDSLGERIAHAFLDTARPGTATLLIGMDTPQVTPALVRAALDRLASGPHDAVLGPAEDGGWWALGLRDAAHAAVLRDVPMSTATTGADTRAALASRGLRVGDLPALRDVDTAADAYAVAGLCPPGSRFREALRVAA